MHIWVDADTCPRPIKEILFRAAERRQVPVTLVANRSLHVPRSSLVQSVQVARGFDVADAEIVDRVQAGDLVVSADVPLAALVIERGATVIDPRGELLDGDSISARLSTRNLMEELRSAGVDTGGPASFGPKDRQRFANQLDRLLSTRAAEGPGRA